MTTPLRIDDGSSWHFVNGAWQDGEAGSLDLTEEARGIEGTAMQGLHFAFRTDASYQDADVSFEFLLYPHSDAGVILRASDESHFYLLHFPNCGQASRAQNFWVALSKMDNSGFLRLIKLELMHRVPSNRDIWIPAELSLRGNEFSLRVGEYGTFEATDDTYREAGAVGTYLFARGRIRNVAVAGEKASSNWKGQPKQACNWFHPCTDTTHGRWQQPLDLIRFDNGELLLSFAVRDKDDKITQLLIRSADKGCTWSAPEPLRVRAGDHEWQPARLHQTPAGRLICFVSTEECYYGSESTDRGRTWTEAQPINLPAKSDKVPRVSFGPAGPINLTDGSILLFLYGGHSLKDPDTVGFPWGSIHCQAFATRSMDDGRSWSPIVNVDDGGRDPNNALHNANLDLTEVCGTQLSSGRIFALIRPCFSPWMWETRSDDGGKSWTPCMRGPFPGYATPNMLRTRAGALLVAHRLPCLTIHTSLDEGLHWDQGTMIDSGLWAMGAMMEIEDNLVLYMYWDTNGDLMRGQYFRITPNGLMPERLVQQ